MQQPAHTSRLGNQRGQAAVFVLALMGVVLVCTVWLYQSGRITSEKMQLQNAADAAAFGASTLEARSLNFAAYTNRAMVANEVAVGQLIGLLSWTDQLTQSEEYCGVYTAALELAGAALAALLAETVVGPEIVETVTQVIVETLDTIAGVLTAVGEALEAVFDVVVSPMIAGLSLINEAYSVSQQIYHGATYALVVKNVYQSLEDNVPGTTFNRDDLFKKALSGAQPSDLGVIALIGHLPSFWSGYTKVYTASTTAKKDAANRSGMGRFAATVREARDPFSSGGKPEERNRNWNLELEIKGGFDIKVVKTKFDYVLGAESTGASELRYKDDSFIWSAADSSVAGSKIHMKVEALGITIVNTTIPFPAEMPFNAGAFQAPEEATTMLLPTNLPPSGPPAAAYGGRALEAYGGAVGLPHIAAYPGVVKEMEENSVETYKGLRPYRDMADMADTAGPPTMPFQAPFFLIGVTKPLRDLTEKGPRFSGHLDLTRFNDETNVDRLGAIAKSELYFSRPTDLAYFARHDRKSETPNVFSPFWQARLVDTSDRDRFLALAMQQQVLWLTETEKKMVGGSVLDDVLHAVDEILDAAGGVVDRLLRLFV